MKKLFFLIIKINTKYKLLRFCVQYIKIPYAHTSILSIYLCEMKCNELNRNNMLSDKMKNTYFSKFKLNLKSNKNIVPIFKNKKNFNVHLKK